METEHKLPAELTIYAVGALKAEWQDRVDGTRPLRADASAVQEIDAAGVQWLASLAALAARAGGSLVLAHPSAALVRACEALGLAGHLGLAGGQGETA